MGLDNPLHIAFLLVILLLVFGAKRLPEIGRSLGEGMRGFKTSIEGSAAPAGVAVPASAPLDTHSIAAAAPAAAVQGPIVAARRAQAATEVTDAAPVAGATADLASAPTEPARASAQTEPVRV